MHQLLINLNFYSYVYGTYMHIDNKNDKRKKEKKKNPKIKKGIDHI